MILNTPIELTAYYYYQKGKFITTVYYDKITSNIYQMKEPIKRILLDVNGTINNYPITATNLELIGKLPDIENNRDVKFILAKIY